MRILKCKVFSLREDRVTFWFYLQLTVPYLAFKQDYISPPIEIVDVYELSLKLLGLSAKNPHNGTWENVAEMWAILFKF